MARKDLPAPGAPNFLARVREELHALLGKTGSDRDRALTLRDALVTGVLVPGPGGSLVPGGGTGGGTTVVEYEPDLTPPPQPGAFTATPAISHILISQAAPFYTQGHGHSRTVVYGAQVSPALPNPVFADAVEVGRFAGTAWGMVSNPATTWRLWIKWESVDGVLSATPSGGTNGVEATTGQDPAKLLEVLAGQITVSELAESLSTPIAQIPGMQTTIAGNATAIADEAAARALALAAEASARATAIANEASIRADADAGLQQQIDIIVNASSGDLSTLIDAVNQERDDRIVDVLDAENAAATADGIITSALAFEASARGIADGALSNANAVTAQHASGALAGLLTEQTIRATADGALATTTTTLAATVGGSVAALQTEASTRATADAAQSAYQTTLAAQTAQTAAAVVSVQTASATADAAQAGQITSLAANTAQAAAAVQVEASVRATADTAQVTRSDAMAAQIGASASAIQTEQIARATVDTALALQTETLSVAVGANQAVIQTEITARASADAAQSSVVAVLATRTGENVAGLVTEQTARTTQDAALAQSITTTQATTGANIAAISAEQSSRTTADTALATQVNVVGAATSDNAARIRTEETARADADTALAARSEALAAASAGAMASINVEQQARTTADTSLATQVDSVLAMTGAAAAGILTEQTARATADAALAQTSTSLQVAQAGNAAAIQAEATARTTADTAAADQIQSIAATSAGAAAAVQSEQSARASADAAQAATSTALAASLAGNVSAIATEQTARATQDSSLAQRVDVLTAAAGENKSAISSNATAVSTSLATQAGLITTLQSQSAGNAAAISTEATTRATQTGELYAQYTVKTDVGGLVSGYGLASQATNGDPVTLTPGLYDVAPERIISVQRNGTATYVDGAGLLQTAAANVARYQGGQVLVEAEATNLLTYSQDFSNASWLKTAASIAVDATASPVAASCFKLVESATSAAHSVQRAAVTPVVGDRRAAFVIAKAAERTRLLVSGIAGNSFYANFDLAGGTFGATGAGVTAGVVPLADGWKLCWLSKTLTTTVPGAVLYIATMQADGTGSTYTGDGSSGVLLACAQFVDGLELSSYIPTTAAPATRAADLITIINPSVTSAFGVQAGQFFVAPPAVAAATAPTAGLFKGYTWRDTTTNTTKYWDGNESWTTTPQTLPFIVQTVPATINGVEVPPGVYMDSAYMRTFVAQAGQIGALAVDDAAIASVSASKITAGSIAVGQYIQSTGIYPGDGTPNFRVDGNGLAILNQAVVRGIVYASGGEFTGTVRGATIIGGTLTTAESGQRVKIDEQGILFLTGASNGKYGSFKYGSKKYGDGVLVYFNNTTKRVPFYVNSEQNVADIHLYNRAAPPATAGEPGDLICVNGKLTGFDPVTGTWRAYAFE